MARTQTTTEAVMQATTEAVKAAVHAIEVAGAEAGSGNKR